MSRVDVDVLVVGLGPTGAVLAGLLALWDVSCLVVESEREVYRLPRAAHFDDEILRVFQQLGVAEEVLRETRLLPAYEFRNAAGDTLLRIVQEGRSTPSGWAASYVFHQPAMEEALRARLATLDGLEIRLGWSLASIDRNDETGAIATITSDRGESAEVRARFVVACDGAGSRTRKMLGATLFDYDFDEPWLVLDAKMTDESHLPAFGLQVCDPKRPTSVIPMGPGRRRWEFMLLPGEKPEEMVEEARVDQLMAPWRGSGELEVVRRAVYRFHGLVIQQWRVGSVLLAGDAAHQMPPFLGEGMCSGIRDAAGLAWKIALVARHGVSDRLLDSYQEEREPHVRMIIETAIGMGRIVCTTDEAVAAERDAGLLAQRAAGSGADEPPSFPGLSGRAFHASPLAGSIFPQPWIRGADGQTTRLDDLLGDGFWLIGRGAGRVTVPAWVKTFDEGSGAAWEAFVPWMQHHGIEAVLVRPDRYVFGTGKAVDLVRALEETLSGA